LSRRHAVRGVVLLALAAVTYFVWRTRESDDERAIRARIESLRDEINSSTVDGLGTVAHAARIGSYFTDDVTIELGEGASAIHGRDTLIGMAARLQPRTAAFRLEIDDVSVEMVPGGAAAADVLLTASFVRRSLSTQEESRDAREFALVCRKNAGTWRIGHVTAIDTLR
jgi:hypothetical protein